MIEARTTTHDAEDDPRNPDIRIHLNGELTASLQACYRDLIDSHIDKEDFPGLKTKR